MAEAAEVIVDCTDPTTRDAAIERAAARRDTLEEQRVAAAARALSAP